MANLYEINKQKTPFDALVYGFTHPLSGPLALLELIQGDDQKHDLPDHTLVNDNGQLVNFFENQYSTFSQWAATRKNQTNFQSKQQLEDFNKEVDRMYTQIDNDKAYAEAFGERIRQLTFLDSVPGNAVKQYLDDALADDPLIRSRAAALVKEMGIAPSEMDRRFLEVRNPEELEHYAKTLDMLSYLAGDHVSSWILGNPDGKNTYSQEAKELGTMSVPEIAGWTAGKVANDGLNVIDKFAEGLGLGGFDSLAKNAWIFVAIGVVALIVIKKV